MSPHHASQCAVVAAAPTPHELLRSLSVSSTLGRSTTRRRSWRALAFVRAALSGMAAFAFVDQLARPKPNPARAEAPSPPDDAAELDQVGAP
jgi:hypothetical protein